jgi:myo-inositol-1(or 4)-monophosphatase
MMINYEAICKATLEIAIEAGDFIRGRMSSLVVSSIETKGLHNFVTVIDKEAEALIVQKLHVLLPEAGFIAEEGTKKALGEMYNWIIDPLDGTTNFIHGAPPVAVSISLAEDNIPVVGVVYEIWLREAFYAWKGSKAYLNGSEIEVSETSAVKDALIATGFPYENFDRVEGFMQSILYFFTHTHGVRRLGSAATDLAYVACGRYDGFYEYNLNPWDIAAGALIIQQAGGIISDFKGGQNYLFGREVVAANRQLHRAFLDDVARFMNPAPHISRV